MSYQTTFFYDNRSNLTCVRDPQNGLTYYTYDAENRQTSVRNPWGEVTYYEYSPGGQMTKRTLGNSCVTYYRHDATGQTSKVENRKGDLAVISSFEYTRDALGNPLRIVREDGYATYYQYDTKSQLTGETQRTGQGQNVYAWTWDYDAAGNRTKQTFNGATTYYSYNAGNELTTETTGAATTYYQYDRCGNTTVQQAPGGTTYYHWDHENLLKQLDLPGGAHNYFSYDADSKRVTKQDSEGFTRFIYQGPDMLKLLQERDTNGGLVAHYTMGQGLEAMRRGSVSRFYHYDWLGSTFELTDASGVVTDSYLYNAWGEMIAKTGVSVNPHGYVGNLRYYRLEGAGPYHVGHRQLIGRLGRFLTIDPAKESYNWYPYVADIPTHQVDPTGLQHTPQSTDCPDQATIQSMLPPRMACGHCAPSYPTRELCLPAGRQFRLKHPELLCAVWAYERQFFNPLTYLQSYCARHGFTRGRSFGPAQFCLDTVRKTEEKFLGDASIPNDLRQHLLPRIKDDADLMRRVQDTHWVKTYMAAWIYMWEQQHPNQPLKFVTDQWNPNNKKYVEGWRKCGPCLMRYYATSSDGGRHDSQ